MTQLPYAAQRVDRRQILRGAGVALTLPWLEAFAPQSAAAAKSANPGALRRRMVFICAPLGLHPPFFFPEKAGADYASTPYLDFLKDLRQDFTVISGLSHPDTGSSHDSIYNWLTAAPHPELRAGFKNSISVDQLAAEKIGGETRFPSLALADEGFSLSWTRSGALVPSDLWPSSVFKRLFLEGSAEEIERQKRALEDGRSILDTVAAQTAGTRSKLGKADKERLDEYLTSVRDLERNLARAQEWSKRPKPKVDVPLPQDIGNNADIIGRTRLMFDLIHLAIQTDSTRFITMLLAGTSLVPLVPGVSMGHHDLSHHGQDLTKIAQLRKIEEETMKVVAGLLTKLMQSNEGGESLLDKTMLFFGSNLGAGSTHSSRNLPVLLAGGGFRHGAHLAFDPNNPPPLSNLYVTMLQRLGLEADRFGSSTGTLKGLDSRS